MQIPPFKTQTEHSRLSRERTGWAVLPASIEQIGTGLSEHLSRRAGQNPTDPSELQAAAQQWSAHFPQDVFNNHS